MGFFESLFELFQPFLEFIGIGRGHADNRVNLGDSFSGFRHLGNALRWKFANMAAQRKAGTQMRNSQNQMHSSGNKVNPRARRPNKQGLRVQPRSMSSNILPRQRPRRRI